MPKPKTHERPKQPPHGHRDRGSANEPKEGQANPPAGSHDSDSARIEAEETFRPDRDGSGQ